MLSGHCPSVKHVAESQLSSVLSNSSAATARQIAAVSFGDRCRKHSDIAYFEYKFMWTPQNRSRSVLCSKGQHNQGDLTMTTTESAFYDMISERLLHMQMLTMLCQRKQMLDRKLELLPESLDAAVKWCEDITSTPNVTVRMLVQVEMNDYNANDCDRMILAEFCWTGMSSSVWCCQRATDSFGHLTLETQELPIDSASTWLASLSQRRHVLFPNIRRVAYLTFIIQDTALDMIRVISQDRHENEIIIGFGFEQQTQCEHFVSKDQINGLYALIGDSNSSCELDVRLAWSEKRAEDPAPATRISTCVSPHEEHTAVTALTRMMHNMEKLEEVTDNLHRTMNKTVLMTLENPSSLKEIFAWCDEFQSRQQGQVRVILQFMGPDRTDVHKHSVVEARFFTPSKMSVRNLLKNINPRRHMDAVTFWKWMFRLLLKHHLFQDCCEVMVGVTDMENQKEEWKTFHTRL